MRFSTLRLVTLTLSLLVAVLLPGVAAAQAQIPPPADPVTVCVSQTPPAADSYQLVFDGGAPEAVTLGAAAGTCPPAATHSFSVPAARFTVGTHTIALVATNAFGSTTGPDFTVLVGIAPGQATIVAVVP